MTTLRHIPRAKSKRMKILDSLREGERTSVELAALSNHENASALAGTLRVLERKGLIICATPPGKRQHRPDGSWDALRWRLATIVRGR
jgi:DNA-binding HxlR family transcriptional regulator